MDDLKTAKQEYRRKINTILNNTPDNYFQSIGEDIKSILCESDLWKDAESVFCYYGVRKEPNTLPILKQILNSGKRLYMPRCTGKSFGEMDIVRVYNLDELAVGAFNLIEPTGQEKATENDIELALVPCIGATLSGIRLGHGGGYYDRFLNRYSNISIVICSEISICSDLPSEAHDESFNYLLTENELIPINNLILRR